MNRFLIAAALLTILLCGRSVARDNGQWTTVDPARSEWFKKLKVPNTSMSCCADADAYEADIFEIDENGDIVAVVTDGTAAPEYGRPEIPDGTRVVVPANRVVIESEQVQTNPTGHGWLFLRAEDLHVYCFVVPSGL